MAAIRRALNSVAQAYREINPATLSGAIDIIVVEQETADGEKMLACSPFHVRFGKLTVLRPVDRKVRVKVNGEHLPYSMKVGETGEAYFVFETEGPIPEHLVASPLSEPTADEALGDNAEVEALDLGPSQVTAHDPTTSVTDGESDQTTASKWTAGSSETDTSATSVNDERFGAPGKGHHRGAEDGSAGADAAAPGVLRTAAEKAGAVGRAVVNTAAETTKLTTYIGDRLARSTTGDSQSEALTKEVDALESEMKTQSGALPESAAHDRPTTTVSAREANTIGDEVRHEARRKQLATTGDDDRDGALPPSSITEVAETRTGSTQVQNVRFDGRGPDIGPLPETSGELLLDMSGYKVKDQDVGKVRQTEEALLSSEFGVSRETSGPLGAGDELLAFTHSLLRAADLERTKSGSHHLRLALAEAGEVSKDDSALSTSTEPDKANEPPLSPVLDDHARPPSPSPSEAEIAATGIITSPSPYQMCLRSDDIAHVFELSVCDAEEFGADRGTNDSVFDTHRISLQQLREEPDILQRTDIVLRYNERFLSWETASPVFFALSRYFRSLEAQSHDLDATTMVDPKLKSAPAAAPPRSWSRWWTRNRSESVLSDNNAEPNNIKSEGQPRKRTGTPPPMTEEELEKAPKVVAPPHDDAHRAKSAPPDIGEHEDDEQPITLLDNRRYAKTLRLSSDQLKALKLKKGLNDVSFTVLSSYSGVARCTARIFFWEADQQVVISDIDGTITKSDALGHVFTMIGRDWTHLGVAKLYTDIARNGYKMLYLTSRAVGQADTTREYLKGISQSGYQLPEGPVIMSPDRLMTSLHREVIMRKPEVFKMACLRDIAHLFKARNPFYAGFGNRITDALSYRSVDVPSSRIFTIDSYGEVKLELLALAGYKSSYIAINDLVDQMFPPINRKAAPEFTDFSFWRAPLPAVDFPDLSPPSPALSARSDSSVSRLRRFSGFSNPLGRKSSATSLRSEAGHRVSSPRPTTTSPLMHPIINEEDIDDADLDRLERLDVADGKRHLRRTSADSMPGSFEEDSVFESKFGSGRLAAEPEDIESRPDLDPSNEEEEEDEILAAGQMEDLDFSSVPVRFFIRNEGTRTVDRDRCLQY